MSGRAQCLECGGLGGDHDPEGLRGWQDCATCGGTGRSTLPAPAEQSALAEMEARKDAAYEERNRVVAVLARLALASGYRAGIARTAIEGWPEDWHGCVYVELPRGQSSCQSSWHYHDSQAHLFADLPPYTEPYDGHTTEQKYERLAAWRVPEQIAICLDCGHQIESHAVNGRCCWDEVCYCSGLTFDREEAVSRKHGLAAEQSAEGAK